MKYLDWIVMILNLYSYYLIGNKKKSGFLLGGIGCILGVVLFINSSAMIIMYSCFGVLNVNNYRKWKI